MTKINKPAGFWIRFLARILDLIIFLAIIIGTAFVLLKRSDWTAYSVKVGNTQEAVITVHTFHFDSAANYYSWLIISIASLFVLFIIIPMLTKGRTLAMLICRIKIDIQEDKTKPWIKRVFARFVPLFKREIFMSLTIGINLILIMALFDEETFNKFTYFSKKTMDDLEKKDFTLSNGQVIHGLKSGDIFGTLVSLKIAIVTTFASILFVGQMILALSIIVRKQRRGFHDSFSKTKTIWEKRMIELKDNNQDEKITSFRPRLVKKEPIEWIE